MDIHENARTTPRSRMLMMQRLDAGWTIAAVAAAVGVDGRTVRKWRDRFRAEGRAGLVDRSSRPHCSPSRLDSAAEAEIAALRRARLSGPVIAGRLERPLSTIGKVLRRLGLGPLQAREPACPVIRYERDKPGELIHLDTKKLGRIDGVGHRFTATGAVRATDVAAAKGWDGKRCTLPSTTPPGWPTPKFCPTRRRRAPTPSSTTHSASSTAMVCRSSAS